MGNFIFVGTAKDVIGWVQLIITGLRKHDYNISPCSVSGLEPVSQGMDTDLPEGQHTKKAGFKRKTQTLAVVSWRESRPTETTSM